MAWQLCSLAFFTLCLFSTATREYTGTFSVGIQLDELEALLKGLEVLTDVIQTMRADQERVKEDQEDLKKNTLKELQAIKEKTEWCLSSGQQGAHPLDERMKQIQEHLESQDMQLTWIKEYLVSKYNQTTQHPPIVPKDCQDVYNQGDMASGVYKISPDGTTEIEVYCEQELDGGGWTVFQHRQDGSVDFYRNWAEYKTGFGDLSGEFWLGNDNIYLLTKDHDQKLKIELTSPDGAVAYADYSTFWIDNENLKYKLHVAGFSGTDPPGDSLTYHDQSNFSTKDSDNDMHPSHCAQRYTGAWWYKGCYNSNLNGVYGSTAGNKGINWGALKDYTVSMTGTKMMVKKKP